MTRRSQFVYFIKPVGFEGPIKIGCSASPEQRRSALENWCPFPLEILAEIEGGFDCERRFHALFEADHIRREWFNVSDRLLAVIASINAANFDLSSLPEPKCLAGKVAGVTIPKTEQQRKQVSYSLRASHAQKRSGYRCPVRTDGIVAANDLAAMQAVNEFVAAPHLYGIPIDWPRPTETRARYHAALARKATPATSPRRRGAEA